jgi:hypothetical protein
VHPFARFAYAPAKIVDEILSGDEPVNATLYQHYSKNFRKAIEQVYHDGGGYDLKANTSRFAAHKAYQATQRARLEFVDRTTGEILDRKKTARATLAQFQAWQTAEYNTAVARARTAKQWEIYTQPNRLRLFPNIKWLPSNSVERRPEHVKFYGRIWAKNDPFWTENTPGTLWNCKCGMQETTDDVTDNADAPAFTPPRGLEGNPGITGEIFTEKASYFQVGNKEKVEKMTYSVARNVALLDALKEIKGKTVVKETKTGKISVGFNRKGLEHLQHDYFPDKWYRDEILRDIDVFLEKSVYADEAKYSGGNRMVGMFYYYKIILLGKEWFFNVRELTDGSVYLYSLTDKIRRK